MAAVVPSTASSQPMIVEKVLALPIVSDIYTYGERATCVRTLELRVGFILYFFPASSSAERVLAPARPYFEMTTASLHPLGQKAASLKAALEDRLPEIVSTGLGCVKDKVTKTWCVFFWLFLSFKAMNISMSLDTTLCSGLEKLMEHVSLLLYRPDLMLKYPDARPEGAQPCPLHHQPGDGRQARQLDRHLLGQLHARTGW